MTKYDIACGPLYAVLDDIVAWDASVYRNTKCDIASLQDRVRTRGLRVLLSDLPKFGKELDRSLSNGYLDISADVSRSLGGTPGEPPIFRALIGKVFDVETSSLDRFDNFPCPILYDPDPTAVAFLRQLLYMYKKLEVPCPQVNVDQEAQKFFDIDEELRIPSLRWGTHDPTIWLRDLGNRHGHLSFLGEMATEDFSSQGCTHPRLRRVLRTLDSVCSLVSSRFPSLEPEDIMPRHGPGAVADLPSGSDKYSLPVWTRKLDHVFSEPYFAYSSEEWANQMPVEREQGEPAARLLSVPKTFDAPRLITAEPTAHQFLQQGLLRWIRQNLPAPLQHSIDFRTQEASQRLALKASSDMTLATVDLSSASDRLSCWTVERALNRAPDLLLALYACRTTMVCDCTTKGQTGPEVSIRKFAGQGSAVTFPIQSIIYTLCCLAAVISDKGWKVNCRNLNTAAKRVQVFGDDLILPRSALDDLALILGFLQLKINVGKTHYQGPFRESCGMDAFRGVDVTPTYLRALEPGRTGRDLTSWVDVCNNAHTRGLWKLSAYMESRIDQKVKFLIPVSSTPLGCLTLRTFTDGPPLFQMQRRNRLLQKEEGLGLVPVAKVKMDKRGGHNALFQYFTETPPRLVSLYQHASWVTRPWSEGYVMKSFFNLKKRWVHYG